MLREAEIAFPRPRDLEVTYSQGFTDIVLELREHIGAIRKPACRRAALDAKPSGGVAR